MAGLSSMATEQGSVNGLTVSIATPPIFRLDIRSLVPGGFAWTTSAISASTSTIWRTTYQIGPGWEEAGELLKFQKRWQVEKMRRECDRANGRLLTM